MRNIPLMGNKKKCPMHNVLQKNGSQTAGYTCDKTQQVHLLPVIQPDFDTAISRMKNECNFIMQILETRFWLLQLY